MIFIIIFLVTVVGAIAHLYIFQSVPRTKERIVEVFLLYFLCVEWGFVRVATIDDGRSATKSDGGLRVMTGTSFGQAMAVQDSSDG